MILYEVDTSGDGIIMPYHIFKSLFPRPLKKHLEETKNSRIMLKHVTKQQIPQ